jgi:hypothetical protein
MKVKLFLIGLCLCSLSSTVWADLNDGLVAHYPFKGNADDASGHGGHGTVYGATLTSDQDGVENNAYEFDGINDYIDFGSALPDMEVMTASLWVFVPGRDRIACIFADTDDLSLKMDEVDEIKIVGKKNGGQLEHGFKLYESLQSNTTFSIGNRWVHMVWVMTKTHSTIYIDGVARGRYFKGGSNVGAHDLQVGCAYWGRGGQRSQNYCWRGKISSMRFYDRILDDSEITALYDAEGSSGDDSANSTPSVTGVSASQRTDGSGIVDIAYTLSEADGDLCEIDVKVSDDGGSTWAIIPSPAALSGDVGPSISPGIKHVAWASKADLPGAYGTQYRVRVTAGDGYVGPPLLGEMVFVSINDPGLPGREGFSMEMSKYETTHAQYCQYLNTALSDGTIIIRSNNVVFAASDTSFSRPYFHTHETYSDSQISHFNGVFSVRSRDGHDMSNHPVARVTGHGATAFAAYYGWRLPTKWEWQAVADYDGSYTYGCGTTIDQSRLNFNLTNPLGLTDSPYTTPVGQYPAYGYGLCDMAGNVWEWTSTVEGPHRAFCGGSWYYNANYCLISNFGLDPPGGTRDNIGFRVCR